VSKGDQTATMLSCEFGVHLADGASPNDLHAQGQRVMEELLKLEQCTDDFTDSGVSTDSSEMTVTVDLMVLGLTGPPALQRALDIVRTAAHAAGAATVNWPVAIDDEPGKVRMHRADVARV